MVKYITAAQTLPLRSLVLRNGLELEKCVFPTDYNEDGFHLGFFTGSEITSIATFFWEDYPEEPVDGVRLRGMATHPDYAGQGQGAAIINFAVSELSSQNASYIWCNARKGAVGFYEKLGFLIASDEFEIVGIGPHFNMIKTLI
ncbi:MAG TPA: GNAT family N-acetyltransferase [Pedobacter sp.]